MLGGSSQFGTNPKCVDVDYDWKRTIHSTKERTRVSDATNFIKKPAKHGYIIKRIKKLATNMIILQEYYQLTVISEVRKKESKRKLYKRK